MLELVKVPGPIVAGGAGGDGGAGGAGGGAYVCCAAVYAACHHLTTLLIKFLAIYGAVSETWVTWVYRS